MHTIIQIVWNLFLFVSALFAIAAFSIVTAERPPEERVVGDNRSELAAKIAAFTRTKHAGDYRAAFSAYAGADSRLTRAALLLLLRDADVGTWATRGAWADGIIAELDADRDGALSWDEVQTVFKR